jgi:tetratricopeptide (TPR) repeat protein
MQAALAFQDALSLSPDDHEIKYQLAIAYKEMGAHSATIELLIDFVYLYPEDPIAYFILGQSYLAIHDYANSKLAFEKSYEINNNDYRTLYYLGLCSFGLSEFRNAAKSLKKALRINPDDAKSHYQLALTYLQLNKVREARKKLNILYMLDMSMYDSLNFYINNN